MLENATGKPNSKKPPQQGGFLQKVDSGRVINGEAMPFGGFTNRRHPREPSMLRNGPVRWKNRRDLYPLESHTLALLWWL